MDSNTIKYKFKKLSPMNVKKLNKNIQNYFIKIESNWFNLIDLYDSIHHTKLNPITNTPFNHNDIKKITKLYRELIEVEPEFNHYETIQNDKLLNDYIDLFEQQINELYLKQEEIYSLTQSHQHELDQINKKIN